jgi:hypothetical protein
MVGPLHTLLTFIFSPRGGEEFLGEEQQHGGKSVVVG